MLPISIDIQPLVDKFCFSQNEIDSFTSTLLDNLSLMFQEEWTNQINTQLHKSRQEYLKGMFVERPDDKSIVFGVTERKSKLAVAIESGHTPFDEKEGFEKSKKRTKTSGGWYLTIPFRHAAPTSIGESSVFSTVMPESIYKMAKSQNEPLTKGQLPSPYNEPGMREPIIRDGLNIPAYQRKSATYEGLIRVNDKDENRGQYLTFRRVSNNSDPNSWWHPGFEAKELLNKSLDQIDITSTVRRVMIDFIENR